MTTTRSLRHEKRVPVDPTLSNFNLNNIFVTSFSRTHFNIILRSTPRCPKIFHPNFCKHFSVPSKSVTSPDHQNTAQHTAATGFRPDRTQTTLRQLRAPRQHRLLCACAPATTRFVQQRYIGQPRSPGLGSDPDLGRSPLDFRCIKRSIKHEAVRQKTTGPSVFVVFVLGQLFFINTTLRFAEKEDILI